ncbi:MAG: hypothetical protein HYS33_04370 [Acidobacteria bacterium]|nr:hypothetical protein [Acidobacteriota bacterium]MBI1983069.1 hypothetical protein [Acidobacteriota bacterium]
MRTVAEKLRELENRVALEKGPFSLFALFLRDGSPDRWDLVVSAGWLEKNKEEEFNSLVKSVQSSLGTEELILLSRVVVVDQENPALEAVHKALRAEHDLVELKDCNFFGLEIKHAYIITSQKLGETVRSEAS